MKLSKLTIQLAVVVFVFTAFAGYSYLNAATTWTAPVGTPPANNVDAPINVGASGQIKNGGLGVSALSVVGGNVGVLNTAPQIEFDDTNADNNKWWIHSNAYGSGPRLHVLYDRNNSGAWDAGDGNPSLYIQSGAAADGTQDILQSPGQVRANQYCDRNGLNCFSAEDLLNSLKIVQTGSWTRTDFTPNIWEGNSGWHYYYDYRVTYPKAYTEPPTLEVVMSPAFCETITRSVTESTKTGFVYHVETRNPMQDQYNDCRSAKFNWRAVTKW